MHQNTLSNLKVLKVDLDVVLEVLRFVQIWHLDAILTALISQLLLSLALVLLEDVGTFLTECVEVGSSHLFAFTFHKLIRLH